MLDWIDRHAALFAIIGLVALTLLGAWVWRLERQLSQTARDSTAQRVVTVQQRCHLTYLILEVLGKDDPRRAPAFQSSYEGCVEQLAKVKKIAASAP